MRRSRLLGGVASAVVASASVGWVAATAIKSPAQVAAETKPPAASDITAPVERRRLASTVTGRGSVRYGQPQSVTLATSTIGGQQAKSLVTKPPAKGTLLKEDGLALEVNGRPVRALAGAVPMYRDIRPGDQGDDVRQLEGALARLGFRPGKVDGVYDGATQGAVAAWYRAAGYSALGANDDEQSQLRAAHTAVSNAESALLQAKEALATVRRGVTAKDVRQAENDVRARERDRAKADADLVVARANEDIARGAEAAARQAEANTRYTEAKVAIDNRLALARSGADGLVAEHRLTEARTAKKVADQRLADDETTTSGSPPRRVASDGQIEGDRAAVEHAANEIVDAQAAYSNAQLAAQVAAAATEQATRQASLDTARAVQATRQAELSTLQAVQAAAAAGRMVDAARDAGDLAAQSLALVKAPPDVTSASASLAKAQRDLSDARSNERSLTTTIGIVVPADEVLFFPTLPLRVDAASVIRGDDATHEVMVVTTSRLAVDAAVSIADARLVHVGDHADMSDTQLGLDATGTVSKVASKPGTDGVTAQQVYLEIVPDDAAPELIGASVAVSISVETTDGRVLAVPVAAVTINGAGKPRVQRIASGGSRHTVPVRTGLSAEGYVEIELVRGRLRVGDRVLVGTGP